MTPDDYIPLTFAAAQLRLSYPTAYNRAFRGTYGRLVRRGPRWFVERSVVARLEREGATGNHSS